VATDASGDESANIGVYTNAEMAYRAADSTIISIAIRGRRLVPGMRDTIRIRITIMAVDSTVVAMDSENELSCTA
jgi:hypothetical protein